MSGYVKISWILVCKFVIAHKSQMFTNATIATNVNGGDGKTVRVR